MLMAEVERAHLSNGVAQHSFLKYENHSLEEFVLVGQMRYGSAFQSFPDDAEFPVIELAVVAAADEEVRGFFKVVNHGVPLELLQRNLEHVRGFFGKPVEEKLEIQSELPRRYFGYTLGTMIVDMDGQHPCWMERLLFARWEDSFRELAGRAWPEDDGCISEDILNYLDHMDALTQQLIELLTEGLGVTSERLTFTTTRPVASTSISTLHVRDQSSPGASEHIPTRKP